MTRGILYPTRLPSLHRRLPPPEVAEFVRWFWIPEWDIPPGQVSRQHLVSFPACNLVVQPEQVTLSGPTTRASHRDLTGRGWAVGALLRPAAVPYLAPDPGRLRDQERAVDAPDLHAAVSAAMASDDAPRNPAGHVTPGNPAGDDAAGNLADDDAQPGPATDDVTRRHAGAVEAFTAWLVRHLPAPTDRDRLANAMVNIIDSDSDVQTIDDVAVRLRVSARTLQRLARRYVGLTPAEMIRRRRLQEAAERVRADPGLSLAKIAAELGYADQAHLTHDFRQQLGITPGTYRGASGGIRLSGRG